MLPAQLQTVLVQQPLGLVFDIDGTLSPIAPTPDAASLYPGVADLLAKAQTHAQVAIMTGRADLDAVMEIVRLRQEGYSAFSIVVRHHDTLPELLAHADYIVDEVEGMAHLLAEIVTTL